MATNGSPQAYVWTGLVTYNSTIYRFEVVTTMSLGDRDAKKIVAKAGGYVRQLNQPTAVSTNDDFIRVMNWAGVKYDVLLKPDRLLTTGAIYKKPVRVRMRGNFSRVYDGEFQSLPREYRNLPRPSAARPKPLRRQAAAYRR